MIFRDIANVMNNNVSKIAMNKYEQSICYIMFRKYKYSYCFSYISCANE